MEDKNQEMKKEIMEDLKEEMKKDFKRDMHEVSTPKSWLSFDKMITPFIINIFFWIFTVASVITGLVVIIQSFGRNGSVPMFFMGLLIIVLGPVITRIYCEIIMVFFKIHDYLRDMKVNK